MAEVFISFIHEESNVAEALQKFIEMRIKLSTKPFLSSDRWMVHAGELWMERIIAELKDAKVVISMLSPDSVKRPWVNFEAGAAWIKEGTALIPVCFGGLTKETLPKPYSSIQAVDLTNLQDQYYLVHSLCHYLGKISPPPSGHMFGIGVGDEADKLLENALEGHGRGE